MTPEICLNSLLLTLAILIVLRVVAWIITK